MNNSEFEPNVKTSFNDSTVIIHYSSSITSYRWDFGNTSTVLCGNNGPISM